MLAFSKEKEKEKKQHFKHKFHQMLAFLNQDRANQYAPAALLQGAANMQDRPTKTGVPPWNLVSNRLQHFETAIPSIIF